MKYILNELLTQQKLKWNRCVANEKESSLIKGQYKEWDKTYGDPNPHVESTDLTESIRKSYNAIHELDDCIELVIGLATGTVYNPCYNVLTHVQQIVNHRVTALTEDYRVRMQDFIAAEAAEAWCKATGGTSKYNAKLAKERADSAYEELEVWQNEKEWLESKLEKR